MGVVWVRQLGTHWPGTVHSGLGFRALFVWHYFYTLGNDVALQNNLFIKCYHFEEAFILMRLSTKNNDGDVIKNGYCNKLVNMSIVQCPSNVKCVYSLCKRFLITQLSVSVAFVSFYFSVVIVHKCDLNDIIH